MKIRTDFVTNSSSSSFILAFSDNSEETILKELDGSIPEEFLHTVLNSIKIADNKSIEEIMEDVEDELYWGARHRLINSKQRKWGFHEAYDYYTRTPEGEEAVKKEVEKMAQKIAENLKDKPFIVEIEYGDDDGSYYAKLEHEIMPYAKATVAVFNHH